MLSLADNAKTERLEGLHYLPLRGVLRKGLPISAKPVDRPRRQPFLSEFKAWAQKALAEILPSGKSGAAFAYLLDRWDKLERFLEHERLTPDNNHAENAIRPFVVGRKNWLFAGTDTGAEASCRVFSLIETAKRNGRDPYGYLLAVLSQLPETRSSGSWNRLLPWNIDARAHWEKLTDTFKQPRCLLFVCVRSP